MASNHQHTNVQSTQRDNRICPLALALCLALLCGSNLEAQSSNPGYPYQALVTAENALVHSGPGKVHYGTQQLKPGDSVEVYRLDPGGWCAIRPPQGSFSLIPESTVEVVREGVGKILEEGTRAWVGTRLDPVDQPLWQVKLRKGELVAVLGELSWPSPEGHSVIWYQIEPPPGEFRWIHQSSLRALPESLPTEPTSIASGQPERTQPSGTAFADRLPELAEPKRDATTTMAPGSMQTFDPILDNQIIGSGLKAAGQPPERPASGWERTSDSNDQIALASYSSTNGVVEPQDNSGINQGWRRSRRAISDAGGRLANATSVPPRFAAVDGQTFTAPIRVADADLSARSLASNLSDARSAAPAGFQRRSRPENLMQLESLLTQELLKDNPQQWQLLDLEEMARRFIQSPNLKEQDWANRILVKIKNCQQLQAGFRNTPTSPLGETFTNQSAPGAEPTENSLRDQFDAVGWLNELTRQHGTQQSQLVLQDENGKITHLIEPIPGINLQRYLKKKIGVVGKRGYHRELKLDHVRVERAYPL